jgi:hypothetical protein
MPTALSAAAMSSRAHSTQTFALPHGFMLFCRATSRYCTTPLRSRHHARRQSRVGHLLQCMCTCFNALQSSHMLWCSTSKSTPSLSTNKLRSSAHRRSDGQQLFTAVRPVENTCLMSVTFPVRSRRQRDSSGCWRSQPTAMRQPLRRSAAVWTASLRQVGVAYQHLTSASHAAAGTAAAHGHNTLAHDARQWCVLLAMS